jgi:hypothetical protein
VTADGGRHVMADLTHSHVASILQGARNHNGRADSVSDRQLLSDLDTSSRNFRGLTGEVKVR